MEDDLVFLVQIVVFPSKIGFTNELNFYRILQKIAKISYPHRLGLSHFIKVKTLNLLLIYYFMNEL